MFTKEDLNNILILIGKTNITGNEAVTVAILQEKIKLQLVELEKTENLKLQKKAEEEKKK